MSKLETPGRYSATVTTAEFSQTDKGTPYIFLSFSTDQGSIGGYMYLSEKALPYTLNALRDAFDFDGQFENAIDQVVGKPCSIVTELEEYNGTERLKVKFINKPSSAKPIDNKDSLLKSLTSKGARIPKPAPKASKKPELTLP